MVGRKVVGPRSPSVDDPGAPPTLPVMGRFVLIRHAKAARPPATSDIDRPLLPGGRQDAVAVGRALRRAVTPDLVVTSPATRARETAATMMAAAGWTAPVEVVDRLYGGGPADVLRTLAGHESEVVIAFGHEPTWSQAVGLLCGAQVTMPTATAVCVEGSPVPGGALLIWMVTPALLGERR